MQRVRVVIPLHAFGYGDVTRNGSATAAPMLVAAEHDASALGITPSDLHIAALKPEQTEVSGVSIA
jgi:hypothetical protein